jgi:hypothetical protein
MFLTNQSNLCITLNQAKNCMNKRLSKERQALVALVLSALCEGTPINAVCRMFRADKAAVLRVIGETGEAFTDYMDANFRDLPCLRIEMDEQWQYVGCHSGRMLAPEKERGDFWLWACILFVEDVRNRVRGAVQIATDMTAEYLRRKEDAKFEAAFQHLAARI